MNNSNPDEELLSYITSLSPHLSFKSGTLDLPNLSDPITLEVNPTPEPTSTEIPFCSSTQTSTVFTQPISSTLNTLHSPTPYPPNLQVTIEK